MVGGVVYIEKQLDFVIERIVFVAERVVLVSKVVVLLFNVVDGSSVCCHARFEAFQIVSQRGYLGFGICSASPCDLDFTFPSSTDLSQSGEFFLQNIMFPSQFTVLLQKLLVFSRGIGIESRCIAARGSHSSPGSGLSAVGAFEGCQLCGQGIAPLFILCVVSLERGKPNPSDRREQRHVNGNNSPSAVHKLS